MELSLFEKFNEAFDNGDESLYDEVRQAFKGRDPEQRSRLFKEYVYYAFPEKGFTHTSAVEFFLWLKQMKIDL